MMIEVKMKRSCLTLKILLLAGVACYIFGCSSELGMNPASESESPARLTSADIETGLGVPESALRFIELPKNKGRDAVTEGGCSAEVVVPRETGVRFVLPCSCGDVAVTAGLLVEPYSIVAPVSSTTAANYSEDVTISLNVSWERLITDVNLVFGPHGTIFDPPATFILQVAGLDLSSYNRLSALGFYYYNEDTDLWERQDATVSVDEAKGEIFVRADLHHFSRYAVAFAH